jgi:hypothetical protein
VAPHQDNPCIKVWLWEAAPDRFRKVTSKKEQPTWIALVPPDLDDLASVAIGPAVGWYYGYEVPEGMLWAHYQKTRNDQEGGY